jgi:hypothetical protein
MVSGTSNPDRQSTRGGPAKRGETAAFGLATDEEALKEPSGSPRRPLRQIEAARVRGVQVA